MVWCRLGPFRRECQKLFEEGKNKWLSNTYEWTRTGYFLYKYEIQKGANVKK